MDKKFKYFILFTHFVFCSSILNAQITEPFTGDYSYSVPLMSVPAPGGPDVPISAVYSAGIKVNQRASDIGLGWFLDAGGAINRSVSGTPDDWTNVTTAHIEEEDFLPSGGALTFSKEDVYVSKYRLPEGKEFRFPDYDYYNVNGSGLSGQLKPYLNDYLKAEYNTSGQTVFTYTGPDYSENKRAEFSFIGDFAGAINSRHYPWSELPVTSSTPIYLPHSTLNGSDAPYEGSGYNASANRLITPNYVEYLIGANGISSFKITNRDGYVYNYSLPIQINSIIQGTFPLRNDYTPVQMDFDLLTKLVNNEEYILKNHFFNDLIVEYKSDAKHAVSWLLTSVSGPDYTDVNSNGVADINDRGYWVNYEWKKWSDQFNNRIPDLGFEYANSSEHGSKTKDMFNNDPMKISGNFGTFSNIDYQIYYLNAVKTTTHTAVFVRDIRDDEHSSIDPSVYNNQRHIVENIDQGINRPFIVNMPIDGPGPHITAKSGTLYDSGGPDGNYYGGTGTITIDPYEATYVTLTVEEFYVASFINDCYFTSSPFYPCPDPPAACLESYVEIFDGPSTSSGLIQKICGEKQGVQFQFPLTYTTTSANTDGAITINVKIGSQGFAHKGFKISWTSDGTINTTRKAWTGTLYDSGGPDDRYAAGSNTYTIAPDGADAIKIDFTAFDIAIGSNDYFHVYDGPNTASPLIGTFQGTQLPPTIVSSGNAITIWFENTAGFNSGQGFALNWEAIWNNRVKVKPQLKLNKIVLLNNEDWATLTVPGPMTTTNPAWDLEHTTNSEGGIYHQQWYDANITAIEQKSLKTIEFNQDYSLCRGYYKNANVTINNTYKLSSPVEIRNKVQVGNYPQSGKLTLNKIVTYGIGHQKATPSILFDYNSSNANDNPDFNPFAIDYWGYHKSDISSLGYSSYRTQVSKGFADAWCLRKITHPDGGQTVIEYESDEFTKIFSDEPAGGYFGSVKTYSVSSVTPEIINNAFTGKCTVIMEDEAPEFNDLITNLPAGTTKQIVIPFLTTTNCGSLPTYPFLGISTGNIVHLSGKTYEITGFDLYDECGGAFGAISYYDAGSFGDLNYSGNGYVGFTFPVGEKIYGGGIRVKNLIKKNGNIDNYKVSYEYIDGVAGSEPDRFNRPGQKPDAFGNIIPDRLLGYERDKHRMWPTVGYSSVMVKNFGQTSQSQGETKYSFITSETGFDNHQPTIAEGTIDVPSPYLPGGGMGTDNVVIINVSDQFGPLFGKPLETEVKDVNGNTISLTKQQYNSTLNGATVELFDFAKLPEGPVGEFPAHLPSTHHICIMRDYPVRLEKTTEYKDGLKSTVEFDSFDDITGDVTKTTATNPVTGVQVTEITPAFRIHPYAVMGAKTADATKYNTLSFIAEKKIGVDPAVTGNNDFAAFEANTFFNSLPTRVFNTSGTGFYETSSIGTAWTPLQSFAATPSLDQYGLHNAAGLVNFNFLPGSTNSGWRLLTESTLFDKRRHVLESRTLSNRFSAAKYVFDDRFPMAQISNCNYESFTCTGFEEIADILDLMGNNQIYHKFEGEVAMSVTVVQSEVQRVASDATIISHTGNYMLKVLNGPLGGFGAHHNMVYKASDEFKGLLKGRIYRISVWIHSSSPNDASINAQLVSGNNFIAVASVQRNNSNNIQIGDWVLLNLDFEVPATISDQTILSVALRNNSSTTPAYFDDFRIHPIDATMSANIYDPKTGLVTATLDANNFATKFIYDPDGRVKEVWQELEGVGLKKVSEKNYHFYRND